MEIDSDRIDEAVLALLYLGLHDRSRAWKGFDWDALDRLQRIPTMSAGRSELMSATCSDSSRPAVPIDVGRGGGSPAGRW
jgi:hypothetical protein